MRCCSLDHTDQSIACIEMRHTSALERSDDETFAPAKPTGQCWAIECSSCRNSPVRAQIINANQ